MKGTNDYSAFVLMNIPDLDMRDVYQTMFDNNCFPYQLITDVKNEELKRAIKEKPEGSPEVIGLILCVTYTETFFA